MGAAFLAGATFFTWAAFLGAGFALGAGFFALALAILVFLVVRFT
jgi:hypothetical protein